MSPGSIWANAEPCAAAASSLASARSTISRVSLRGAAAQRPQRDDDRGGLGGRQPQRAGQVVGVGDPDDAVAAGPLQGVEVDVDEVVGVAAGQAAHQQHVEVGEHLLGGYAERGRGVVEPDRSPGVQERHQGQQPGDLVLGAGRLGGHEATSTPRTTARSRSTTSVRSSAGDSTYTSAP